MVKENYLPKLRGNKRREKMKHIITSNTSEIISVITDEDRVTLKQEIRGRLPKWLLRYKIIILNKREAQNLSTILNNWLKNNIDRT